MKDLLQKIKRANIPNTYYALIALACFSIIGVIKLADIAVQGKRVSAGEVAEAAKPALAPAARDMEEVIALGMPRAEVARRLGTPTWAVTPEDDSPLAPPSGEDFALEWHWANPACREAVVLFSADNRVVGWDAGTDYCRMAEKRDYSDLSCTLPERAALCR